MTNDKSFRSHNIDVVAIAGAVIVAAAAAAASASAVMVVVVVVVVVVVSLPFFCLWVVLKTAGSIAPRK